MKYVIVLAAMLISLAAFAQTPTYSIERDSTTGGFVMIQGAHVIPFDTATVSQNLKQKDQALQVIENEISLLERLVLLRRQAAQVREEKNTLVEILEKARKCGTN
ncbi:MAG: hypothetical protein EPGJADBJ_04492 [Saprospiraceae bacterium]|nr:hypothetical protein [Saprospiraceae bacterium]